LSVVRCPLQAGIDSLSHWAIDSLKELFLMAE